jgi:hypothetical protein
VTDWSQFALMNISFIHVAGVVIGGWMSDALDTQGFGGWIQCP